MKEFNIYDIEFTASRFNPVPLNNDFLDNRYEWQKNSNAVEWPYYRFFYYLAKVLQPSLVVELGGWRGTSAAHFAAGYSGSQVITIDHHTDPGDDHNKEKMIEVTTMYNNVTYIQGWTNDILASREKGKHALGDAPNAIPRIEKICQYKKIDILFIDSWHTYDNAMLDWKYYKPLLESPSLVICDDIQSGELKDAPISGMMRFWREMPEPKFLNNNLHPSTQMGFFRYE